jgi:hypothetical protein
MTELTAMFNATHAYVRSLVTADAAYDLDLGMRADGRVYLVLTLTRTGVDEQRMRFRRCDDGTWVREALYAYLYGRNSSESSNSSNHPEIPESSP